MIRLKNIVVMLSVLCVVACTENNIAYDEVVNVPEGIYLSGSSSEFSVPIETGRLKSGSHANMFSIRAWLKKEGRFQISFVGTDGQPVTYGKASPFLLKDFIKSLLIRSERSLRSFLFSLLCRVRMHLQRREVLLLA